jgi:hypothetical protein
MKQCFLRRFAALLFLTQCFSARSASAELVIASKTYVDSIVAAVKHDQANWNENNVSSAAFIKNKPVLSAVAVSGRYEDLINKPAFSGGVYSASKTGAASGDSFHIALDRFLFRAFKSGSANYWGIRIVNNTGASLEYSTRGQHYYSAIQPNIRSGTLVSWGDVNPDVEANDIGYSGRDVYQTFFTDWTNMHYYRWTVSVNAGKAIMVVEKLY